MFYQRIWHALFWHKLIYFCALTFTTTKSLRKYPINFSYYPSLNNMEWCRTALVTFAVKPKDPSFNHTKIFCTDQYRPTQVCYLSQFYLWGHPFMTSTWRGEGVRLRWTHVDEGRGVKPHEDYTLKIKIRVHWRHTVFFSCKEVFVFFTRISSLDRNKVEILLRSKLLIVQFK